MNDLTKQIEIGDKVRIKSGAFAGEVCTVEKLDRLPISGGHQATLRRLNNLHLWVRDNNLIPA